MATVPHENDVLLGRGKSSNAHIGNQRFRSIVDARKPEFQNAKKRSEKREIALAIVDEIRGQLPPGRFLMEDPARPFAEGGSIRAWVVVEDGVALKKVMHRLRDKGGTTPDAAPESCQTLMERAGCMAQTDSEALVLSGNTLRSHVDGAGGPQDSDASGPSSRNGKADPFPGKEDGGDVLGKDPKRGEATKEGGAGLAPHAHHFDGGHIQQDSKRSELGKYASTLGDIDEAVGLFLSSFSAQHDDRNDIIQTHELTLRQWIERSKLRIENTTAPLHLPSDKVSERYVKATLPVALSLTEFLIEAERDELSHGLCNAVPLESIRSENVLLRTREHPDGLAETVEYAWIMSCAGDSPTTGGSMPRLFALGIILYELFTGEDPSFEEDWPTSLDDFLNVSSVKCIDLSDEDKGAQRPQKRAQKQWPYPQDNISGCVSNIESKGIPWPVCAVVKHLLECGQGDFCRDDDDAYTSLADVGLDLKLMLKDPARFFHAIETNPVPNLSICNELFGREREVARLKGAYERHLAGECSGAMIIGGAGVGKSALAKQVMGELSEIFKGYLLTAKFDQSEGIKPLSTIGETLNMLCNMFSKDATLSQLEAVGGALEGALGEQAGLLAGLVPGLAKLMSPGAQLEARHTCVDSALSMRFQFGELLRTVSGHSVRPIFILIDDVQWADSASLLLMGNLMSVAAGSGVSPFFAFCHRGVESCESGPLDAWLSSVVGMFDLEEIRLGNMNSDVSNELVSNTLRLSPRITRPLALVMHRKTCGNPFFLRRLMASLNEQNFIYPQLVPPRWSWDMTQIIDLRVPDDVVDLLIEQMRGLHPGLQLGLKVLSCMGASVERPILEILSKEMEVDLQAILRQLSQEGFIDDIDDGESFCFVHDKVQQAAFELMSEQEQRQSHMRYGLAFSVHALSNEADGDKLLFESVNQLNRGGPNAVYDPSQKSIIAELNLKAGRCAADLSEYDKAFQLFKHGISFLGDNHWETTYRLSMNLFDAAAETACIINKDKGIVEYYAEPLLVQAKSYDDKLNCLITMVRVLRQAELLKESMEATFEILVHLGEELPRETEDSKLIDDVCRVNDTLQKMSDDSILNLQQPADEKIFTLLKLYATLANLLHSIKPSLIYAVSVRMIALTLSTEFSFLSPLAFAYYGESLVARGNLFEGCRLGRLALKLVRRKGLSTLKSNVIGVVYHTILWLSEPLQCIAEAHGEGAQSGQQSGDFLNATMNLQLSIMTNFVAGQSIEIVLDNIRKYICKMQRQNKKVLLHSSILLHSQAHVLKSGLHILDVDHVDNIPTERKLPAQNRIVLGLQINKLMRAILFHQLDDISFKLSVYTMKFIRMKRSTW